MLQVRNRTTAVPIAVGADPRGPQTGHVKYHMICDQPVPGDMSRGRI
jgi:hypothetical protein